MKRKLLTVLFFLGLCLLWAQPVIKTEDIAENWQYQIEINNPGTRSEGSEGLLLYKGQSIGAYFDTVIISAQKFDYFLKENLWDEGGYLQDTGFLLAPTMLETVISEMELFTGWYESDFYCQKPDTPASWIYVVREDWGGFLDPDKRGVFQEQMGLGPILPFGLDLQRQ